MAKKERQKEKKKERQKGRNTQSPSPFNPSVGSLCHVCATATYLSYRFFIFEISATALCGTAGIKIIPKSGMERILKPLWRILLRIHF
jgi:hypothetical protein